MICKVGDIFRTTNDKDGDYTLAKKYEFGY